MKYKYAIAAGTAKEVADMVSKYINDGWKCQGGLAICRASDGIQCMQALIKEIPLINDEPDTR